MSVAFDSIAWEPYVGLRAYRFAGNGHWVEYYRGGSLEAASTATSCSSLPATYGSYDFSGRTRGLFVSDGPMTLGTPNGNIFKQVYTWDADQLVVQQTCHRSSGSVVKETFGYDKTQRLVSNSDVNMGTSLSQVFDKRGNRTNSTLIAPQSCQQNVPFWTAAWQVDMPFSTRWGPAFGSTCNATAPSNGSYNYYYDRDGRRTDTWDEFNLYHVTTGFPQSTLGAGLDSVYQTAVVSGGNYLSNQYVNGTYSYFYDAFGRRRAKTTPWNTTDEFFYDLGHQMLTDRGANTVAASATEYPEDDYIWLDGRPLMIVRGKFVASTMARAADDPSLTCQRNGEVGLCGSFELVTDYLGKPVVAFDRGGTAGTSTYEVLGYSNRREYRVGSPHGSPGTTTVATLTPTMPPGFDGPLRVLMSRSNYSTSSSVSLAGVVQSPLQGNKSHVWSDWQYSSTNSWAVSWTGSGADYGFDMEAYEVRAKQAWVWWAWTPLRFPGQYFDPETELHENWNRYYDPSTGRYLSPEPLLQDPMYVSMMAQGGMSTPTYAYALNNPIRYTDPTGKNPLVIPAAAVAIAAGEALVATGVISAGVYCIGTQCLGNLHWPSWDPPGSTVVPTDVPGAPSIPNNPAVPDNPAKPDCEPQSKNQQRRDCRGEFFKRAAACASAPMPLACYTEAWWDYMWCLGKGDQVGKPPKWVPPWILPP
ncbi:MAG: RHS repeat-associated core domain-containing protein [Archangium sp.]|nr:RHS repeat-associated core domain-containing protein [Archangium sp.]